MFSISLPSLSVAIVRADRSAIAVSTLVVLIMGSGTTTATAAASTRAHHGAVHGFVTVLITSGMRPLLSLRALAPILVAIIRRDSSAWTSGIVVAASTAAAAAAAGVASGWHIVRHLVVVVVGGEDLRTAAIGRSISLILSLPFAVSVALSVTVAIAAMAVAVAIAMGEVALSLERERGRHDGRRGRERAELLSVLSRPVARVEEWGRGFRGCDDVVEGQLHRAAEARRGRGRCLPAQALLQHPRLLLQLLETLSHRIGMTHAASTAARRGRSNEVRVCQTQS